MLAIQDPEDPVALAETADRAAKVIRKPEEFFAQILILVLVHPVREALLDLSALRGISRGPRLQI